MRRPMRYTDTHFAKSGDMSGEKDLTKLGLHLPPIQVVWPCLMFSKIFSAITRIANKRLRAAASAWSNSFPTNQNWPGRRRSRGDWGMGHFGWWSPNSANAGCRWAFSEKMSTINRFRNFVTKGRKSWRPPADQLLLCPDRGPQLTFARLLSLHLEESALKDFTGTSWSLKRVTTGCLSTQRRVLCWSGEGAATDGRRFCNLKRGYEGLSPSRRWIHWINSQWSIVNGQMLWMPAK